MQISTPIRQPWAVPQAATWPVRPQLRFASLKQAVPPQPFGVRQIGNQLQFQVWAPRASRVELMFLTPRTSPNQSLTDRIHFAMPMDASPDGLGFVTRLKADFLRKRHPRLLYMYRLTYPDGSQSKLLPDPRSRYQPEDVHGPSEVIDPNAYRWQTSSLRQVPERREVNIYELHIGTLTQKGTFAAAIQKLDEIKALGINTIQVMPVKEFAGKWNWGYDMVDFFATENAYGHPDDFKRFIDEAHKRGLAVVLDVVYNHVGPEGNYLESFDDQFLSPSSTPWGKQFNWFSNPQAKAFVLDNLTMWMKEYRVDGFRFDMTNYIPDDVLRAFGNHVYGMDSDAIMIAEDGRNSNHVTLPLEHGGLGNWGKWNFSYHHSVKSIALGRSHMNAPTDAHSLAHLLRNGFPPGDIPMNSLFDGVNFYESHDEVGNHDGFRASTKTSRDRSAMLSVLKFLVPGIPMTWMGEEYGEKNPFYFFVNYSDPACVAGVQAGRRSSGQPDCTNVKNFLDSKLSWQKDEGLWRLNQALITLRKTVPALWEGDRQQMRIDDRYLGSGVLVIHRRGVEHSEDEALIVMNLSDHAYQKNYALEFPQGTWREVLNSQDQAFGGHANTNGNRFLTGLQEIELAPWSVAVFRKKAV